MAVYSPLVAELFASARLIEIQRPPKPGKPPGIRPIATGNVFGRVVATMVQKNSAAEEVGFLLSQKVSLALAEGTEVLIHGFRDVLSTHGFYPGKAPLRVDAINAFNSILRAVFLRLAILHESSAVQLVFALYVTQPYLTVGGQLLRSREGAQQGEPLGGLLFRLSIPLLVKRINCNCRLDLNAWYSDGGNIVGDPRSGMRNTYGT